MAQSLAKLHVHLVFSTKNREPWLVDEIRPDLHAYLGGILSRHHCVPVRINSEPDHVHILFLLGRTITPSDVVANLKKGSNDWLRSMDARFSGFYWQGGYGAFSVSQSAVDKVREYIENQHEHHRRKTFQEELREMFRKHEVEFDERFVWE